MREPQRLLPLVRISRLLLDSALARVEHAARARDESRAQIARLAAGPVPEDMPPVAAALAELRYQQWADKRRAEINLTLARQTADWLDAREKARRALGRAETLRKLAERR